MTHICNRRSFLKTTAATGAALALPGVTQNAIAQGAGKSLCIVQAKDVGAAEGEVLTDLSVKLTRRALEELGGISRFVSKGDVVWVKPNIGWDRTPEQAANTNPDVVKTLVTLAFEAGAAKVKVSDNTCQTARRTYERSGIQKAAEEAGAEVLFHDERKYKEMEIGGENFKSWPLYAEIVEADKIINCPIAKDHKISNVTLSLKNLMGVMGGRRNQVHQKLGPFLADLAAFLKPQLTVIDAIRILVAEGPTGGRLENVERKDTIIAGTDFVAADAYGVSLFGRDIKQVAGVLEAEALGLGTTKYETLAPEPVIIG